MFIFIYFLLEIFLFSFATENIDILTHRNWPKDLMKTCGNSNTDRIRGGVDASLGQFPYFARLGYGDPPVYKCGGALISKQFVLSVAHCFPSDLKLETVQFGEHSLLTEIDCNDKNCADPPQIYKPIKIIKFEGFNEVRGSNDIALIKLDKEVKMTEWISSVCLPYGDILKTNFINEKADLVGFGLINAYYSAKILQTIKLPIVNVTECSKIFEQFDFGDGIICAGGEKNKDSCDGDSGSPFVKALNSETGPRYFLIGLVSYGRVNCNKQAPAMYTNVSHYIEWIVDNMD